MCSVMSSPSDMWDRCSGYRCFSNHAKNFVATKNLMTIESRLLRSCGFWASEKRGHFVVRMHNEMRSCAKLLEQEQIEISFRRTRTEVTSTRWHEILGDAD